MLISINKKFLNIILKKTEFGGGKVVVTNFATVVGYLLGILIVFVVSGVFLKPLRYIARFLINSLGGILLAIGINALGAHWGIHIGINPFTAIVIGILGIPGVIAVLIAQIFF